MRKILVAILLTVFVLMLTGCGNSNGADEHNGVDSQIADNTDQTNTGENGVISAEEAENILREYLISVNIWKSDYVLESFDPVLGEFENGQIFRFEMRFKEDIDEVGGRLIGNYAITTDGERIFWYNPADDEWVEQIIENVSTEGVADYPAVIMVNDTIYLLDGVPMPAEVDESAIIGYTESFTDTFPENNGETNFNPELGMPYAQVEGGIAVYYQNEWYLATPTYSSAVESENQTEEVNAVNLDELADVFGISISLPENPNWIVNSVYHLVDENHLEITYYDPGIDSDCVILVAKNEALALPENEYDEGLNESWEGWTINGQHIVVKVQRGKNGSNTVLATWDYNEYQFAIIGEIEGELDSGPIAKVALFIIENLN